mmetsp:Transcript_7009/g.30791  ORF Transcript_7009/g.30791 Transcript_7009/m.30791 type:complete len:378 (-) Transcript_7009:2940-4073(-)
MKKRLVNGLMGLGSCVVDHNFPVSAGPRYGQKTFFLSSPSKAEKTVGGVTLNHLSWASALGVQVGLVGTVGQDSSAGMIVEELRKRDIDCSYLYQSLEHHTSESYVFVPQTAGERTVVMFAEPKRGRLIGVPHWLRSVSKCEMASSEIHQFSLETVLKYFSKAKRNKVTTALDFDMPASDVVGGKNKLGNENELIGILENADVIKASRAAAWDLVGQANTCVRLRSLTGAKLVVITDGPAGSELCVEGMKKPMSFPAVPPTGKLVNTLGAGDAFFGGLLASLYANYNEIPTEESELRLLAEHASACGAICCMANSTLAPTRNEMWLHAKDKIHEQYYNALRDLALKVRRRRANATAPDRGGVFTPAEEVDEQQVESA